MTAPSNYPPGETGASRDLGLVTQACANGHWWEAPMFAELGGSHYENDDDAFCPTCGAEDVRNSR